MNVELGTSGTAVCGTPGNQLHISSSFTFIRKHPLEINLGRLDAIWFLDMILLKGREASEGRSRRRTDVDDEAA